MKNYLEIPKTKLLAQTCSGTKSFAQTCLEEQQREESLRLREEDLIEREKALIEKEQSLVLREAVLQRETIFEVIKAFIKTLQGGTASVNHDLCGRTWKGLSPEEKKFKLFFDYGFDETNMIELKMHYEKLFKKKVPELPFEATLEEIISVLAPHSSIL